MEPFKLLEKQEILSIAKPFINPTHVKEIIRGVYFDTEGNAWATDAHRLIRISGLDRPLQVTTIGLDGKPLEGEYPNVQRLIPENEIIGTINLAEGLQGLKSLLAVAKVALEKTAVVKILSVEGTLKATLHLEGLVTGTVEIGTSEKAVKVSLNLAYLISCLEVFRKEFETVDMRGTESSFRPIVFEKSRFLTLLLPVRTY